jgi:single-strand DNA-binding protein
VATSKTWTKDGEKQEKTSWHRIVVWGKLAELCNQYLEKGSQCFIEGEIDYQSWEDDQGAKHYATDIVAHTVQFLGGKNESND